MDEVARRLASLANALSIRIIVPAQSTPTGACVLVHEMRIRRVDASSGPLHHELQCTPEDGVPGDTGKSLRVCEL